MKFPIKTLCALCNSKTSVRTERLTSWRKEMWTIAAICLTAVVAVTTAQPECNELGFQDRSSFTGAGLSMCRIDGAQCCTDEYLEEVKENVRDRLEDYLGEEFQDVIEEYEDEIEDLLEYFTEEFTENMLLNFPFSELLNRTDPVIRSILRNLIENFVIRDDDDDEDEDDDEETDEEESDDDDDFNVGAFIRRLITAIIRVISRTLGGNRCIDGVIESLLDEDIINQLVQLLRRIRRAITALMRIGRFLERQKDRFEDAEILKGCVSRFIEIAYCKRCTQKTPPMCFRTCNALVRGCYSPYYTVLNAQYRRLWEEVQRIVEVANTTVSEFFSKESALIDRPAMVRMLRSECRVRVSDENSRKKRHHSDSGMDRSRRMSTKDTTDSMDSESSGSGSGSGEEKTGMSRTGMSRTGTSMTETTMTKTTTTGTTKTSKSRSSTSRSSTSRSSTSRSSTSRDTTGNTDSSSRPKPDPEEPTELPEIIPFEVVDDVLALNSAFQYGMRRRNVGLKLCLKALIDGDESCNKTDGEREYCKGMDLCTSRCYCTDGKTFTMDNETDQTFDSNEVDDQGGNPVLNIDEADLQEEVDRLTGMGDPVQEFLASEEFTSVDPRQQDEEEGDTDDSDVDNSTAGLGVATLSVLLLAAVTVLL